jgi:hypothetical protein
MDFLLHPGAADLTLPQLAVELKVTQNLLSRTTGELIDSEDAISNYIRGKEKDPNWNAYSPENMERLKQLRTGSYERLQFAPKLSPA